MANIKSETTALDLKILADKIGLKDKLYIVMKDQLKFVPISAKNIIINLASTGHPGTHWVCLRQNIDDYEYFDSFGQPALEEVINYTKKNNNQFTSPRKPLYHSNIQYQTIESGYCGEYCLLYLYCQENNIDIKTMLKPIRTF